jgi:large subunit ribosomal protein L4
MKIAVKSFDQGGQRGGQPREIELPDEVFGYPYKEHLIHEAVQAYLAGRRRGTHKTKTRAEVSGSGKKLWRQKGTGRARVGDIRNPKWRKGGVVWGPVPHSHAKDLSAGEKRNALKSALSRKLAEERIVVLDNLEVDSHRTKDLIERLGALGIDGKALLVDSLENDKLALAARNNRALKTVDALAVNVYDVVDRGYLVLSEGALNRLVEVLAK